MRSTSLSIAAVSVFILGASAAHATGGAIGHWTLDEGGGSVVNDSAGSANGAVLGGAAFIPTGVAGGAMNFHRATNDRVDFGDVFGFGGLQDFSVSMWIRIARGAPVDNYPVSKHFTGFLNGWFVFVGPSGTCYGQRNRPSFYTTDECSTNLTAPVNVNDNAWHHLVCTYDAGQTKRIYVDGDLEATGGANFISTNPNSELVFGGYSLNGTPTGGYDGDLDDVQIYDRALSCAEARYLFTHPGLEASVTDLNGDGAVNGPDLAILLGAWGPCGASCEADFDCSGSVDAADLAVLLGSWTA